MKEANADKVILATQKEGIARIVSRFKWNQIIWFMDGRHILNGTIQSIKGSASKSGSYDNLELELLYTSGEIGAHFRVREEDCFESKQALIDAILN